MCIRLEAWVRLSRQAVWHRETQAWFRILISILNSCVPLYVPLNYSELFYNEGNNSRYPFLNNIVTLSDVILTDPLRSRLFLASKIPLPSRFVVQFSLGQELLLGVMWFAGEVRPGLAVREKQGSLWDQRDIKRQHLFTSYSWKFMPLSCHPDFQSSGLERRARNHSDTNNNLMLSCSPFPQGISFDFDKL